MSSVRAANILSHSALPDCEAAPAKTGIRVLHLLYHELSLSPQTYSYVVLADTFREHLNFFRTLGDQPGIQPVLTFDDGHSSNYEIAFPLLEEQHRKATFFITGGWTGTRTGFMGWDQLKALQAAGHTIGAHGWSHKLLTHCDKDQLHKELVDSRNLLQDRLGTAVTTLSFPGGRFNQRILLACADAGYTQLYTSIPQVETTPMGSLVGRTNVHGDWTLARIASLFASDEHAMNRLRREDKLKRLVMGVLGDTLYASLWAILNRKQPEADAVEDTSA